MPGDRLRAIGGREQVRATADQARNVNTDTRRVFRTRAMDDDRALHRSTIPGPADDALVDAVRYELSSNNGIGVLDIEVIARNGIVVLRGVVGHPDDIRIAEAIAARVDGVIEVREHLELWAG